MLYNSTLISLLEVLTLVVPTLLTVAFVTIAERKTMASMQRRVGPNEVGYYGILQAFADALKLLLKEYISPTQSNLVLFFFGPIITLVFSLFGYSVIAYGPGVAIFDFNLGILYMLAVSSLATYGILLAGWSANSKYAFLGSLRSTAQLISYELILSSAILLVVLLSGSLNLSVNMESQSGIWYIFPLAPVALIFFIGSVAETNRAPFDLAEAESELVSGFMTEHSSVIFVFFFLAEYASMVLICVLTSMLFLGGYSWNFPLLTEIFVGLSNVCLYIDSYFSIDIKYEIYDMYCSILYGSEVDSFDRYMNMDGFTLSPAAEGILSGMILGLKSCVMIFIFIWVRASFPRIRYDQLMSFCWTILLPLIIGFIISFPCILSVFSIFPCNIPLL